MGRGGSDGEGREGTRQVRREGKGAKEAYCPKLRLKLFIETFAIEPLTHWFISINATCFLVQVVQFCNGQIRTQMRSIRIITSGILRLIVRKTTV